jgi:hypothetical protein
MITLKEFMEVVKYRITEGSDYYGDFGCPAYHFSYWNGDNDEGHSVCIVFNTENQTVISAEVCDYKNRRAYRLINPDYKDRSFDDEAWDDIKWTELEADDDWIQKALAIINGEEYDTRVTIPLDISNDEFNAIAHMAHEHDITFNQMVEKILWAEINRIKNHLPS